MPKRASVSGEPKSGPMAPPPAQQRKTERSHEENQERAYIAASRRADRSLEARVQSARMASEIHKKRTGKGFRITEEIVVKEEMYEEEDDDLPRSYRLLGPHMQTASHEMNSKVDAYLTNKMAMSAYLAKSADDWRSNEINQLFARSFPNAGLQAQHLTQNMPSSVYGQGPQSPVSPTHPSPNTQESTPSTRGDSTLTTPVSPNPFNASISANLFSPRPEATQPKDKLALSSDNPLSPMEFEDNDSSAFTTELPNDVKMMVGGADPSNPFTQGYFNQDWMAPTSFYNCETDEFGEYDLKHDMPSDATSGFDSSKWDSFGQSNVDEPSWDSFINDSAWTNE